ncbi:MAG TPA: restriction endonuclease subunit S [Bacteroides fragilis]|nr:restriction endonuclease subunit S [Bacteroides fragilis]
MEQWKQYKIGDLCSISSSKRIFAKEYQTSGIPFYRGKEVIEKQKGENVSTELYISEARYNEIKNKFGVPEEGDMLLTSVGTLGVPYVVKDETFYFKDGNLTWFGNFKGLNSKFLYYWFLSPMAKNAIDAKAIGSTQKALTIDALSKFEIDIPNVDVQNRIVSILSSLDNKIELNRRINDNLEQQAQALFKSWFVDNSNPNLEETSLSEVASFVGGYSYTGEELTDCSNIAMATIKNFGRNGGFKADGFKGINPSAKLKECHYANLFDILVAHTDLTQNADVIGNAELLLTCGKYDSIIFSMDLVKVLPKETFPYRFLLAAMLRNKLFKGHSLGYVNGTTVLHLSKKALPDFEIRKPSDSESKMMDEVLASYYKRMAELLQENDRLISLRDTLLPKLMSGELKINDLNS